MRWTTLAVCGLLGTTFSALLAQNPPPQQSGQTQPAQTQPAAPKQPVMTPEQQKTLGTILSTWEADARSLQALYVNFAIEETDAAFPTPKKSYGEAKVLKMPSGRYGFSLEIFDVDAKGNPIPTQLKTKYVFSENWMYNFDIPTKTIITDPLKNMAFKPDDGPFAFLFGMKATDAARRFRMTLVQEDQAYHWLRIEAMTDQDRKDFIVAQLGVVKDNYANCPKGFPVQIQYRDPPGNLKHWVFKQVIRNDLSKVAMSDFSVEQYKKAGWQIRAAPQNGAQTVNPGQIVPAGANGTPRK